MASLDEAVCHVRLAELLTSGREDETRYGAFRALRTLNPRHKLVQGELLNESFWLHRVAPNAAPLVHISSTRRAEIVIFGEEPMLKPDVRTPGRRVRRHRHQGRRSLHHQPRAAARPPPFAAPVRWS